MPLSTVAAYIYFKRAVKARTQPLTLIADADAPACLECAHHPSSSFAVVRNEIVPSAQPVRCPRAYDMFVA
eukprot:scaffold274561_cov31-Tisochrysis_lutea.AAC.1